MALNREREETVANVVDLVMSSFRITFPSVTRTDSEGKTAQDRMVTSEEQIKFVSGEELTGIAQEAKPAKDILLFTLLKHSGIPADFLKSIIYWRSEKKYSHYSYHRSQYGGQSSVPKVYLNQDYLSGFASEDRIEQMKAAINLGMTISGINFDLVPKAVDISDNLKPKFVDWIIDGHNTLIANWQTEFSESILKSQTEIPEVGSVANIELAKAIVPSLLNGRNENYHPRIVAYGGKVLLILPHQSLDTVEIDIGTQFHNDIYGYLAEPVIGKFLDLLTGRYGVKSIKETYLKWFRQKYSREQAIRVAPILHLLGLDDSSVLFDAYKDSRIPILLAQSKKGRLNTERYPS